jgi:hypothetical protein
VSTEINPNHWETIYLFEWGETREFGTAVPFSEPIGGPDNGSRVVLIEGGLSPAQPTLQYNASTGLVSTTALVLDHFNPVAGQVEDINPPVFDRKGTRMLVPGSGSSGFAYRVYDATFSELGLVPSGDIGVGSTTAAFAISPSGDRAYTLEIGTGVCRVRAFNLTASPGAEVQFAAVGIFGSLRPVQRHA